MSKFLAAFRARVSPTFALVFGLAIYVAFLSLRLHGASTQLDTLRSKYDGAASVEVVQVHDAQGRKLGAALVPQRAGDFFVSPTAASPFAIKDGSSVTRDTFETTHGRITAGGGGSDVALTCGPQSGAETTTAACVASTGASGLTLGTNKAGATLTLQADAAIPFVFGKVNGNSMETDWTDKTGATQDVLDINAVAGVIQHSSPNAFEYVWTVGAGPSSELILGTGADQLEYATGQSFQILNNSASQVALFNDNGTALGKTTGNNSFIGSVQYTTRTVTASFTVDTTTTDRTIWANTSGGAFTVTLPTPTAGRELVFVDSGHSWATNHLTIARHGTETINGVGANLSVVSGSGISGVDEICRVLSDGTNWQSDCK